MSYSVGNPEDRFSRNMAELRCRGLEKMILKRNLIIG